MFDVYNKDELTPGDGVSYLCHLAAWSWSRAGPCRELTQPAVSTWLWSARRSGTSPDRGGDPVAPGAVPPGAAQRGPHGARSFGSRGGIGQPRRVQGDQVAGVAGVAAASVGRCS